MYTPTVRASAGGRARNRGFVVSDRSDVLVRYLDVEQSFRVVACSNTGVVDEAVVRHRLSGLAAIALGRAITAAQLLATMAKGDERVTLQLNGDGPLRSVMADAWSNGAARGYVGEPIAVPVDPPDPTGRAKRPHVGKILGRGTVSVIRDLGLKDLYHGTGPMHHGEIDEAVEGYLRISEQIPSALGCEVRLDEEGTRVTGSVGVMVQGMPGTRESAGHPVREAQHALRKGVISKGLCEAQIDLDLLAASVVEGHLIRRVGDAPLRFHCPCDRDRVSRALLTLGSDDLRAMLEDVGHAQATCHFCGTHYVLDAQHLQALITDAGGEAS